VLNPPFAASLIVTFVDKLLEEIAAGHVRQAILIVHPRTDAQWFQRAAAASAVICFAKRRISFWTPHKKAVSSPMWGTALLYYGKHPKRFQTAFRAFGRFYNFIG
jgi:hypothetical protein